MPKQSQNLTQAVRNAEARGIDFLDQISQQDWIQHASFDGENEIDIFENAYKFGKKAQNGESLFSVDDGDDAVLFFRGREADLISKINAL